MGPLGAVLGGSWAILGRAWTLLAVLGGSLGRSWALPGGLGRLPGHPGRPWGSSWGALGRSKIDQKIDPKIDPKSSRIRESQNGPNPTPADVSERSEPQRLLHPIAPQNYLSPSRSDSYSLTSCLVALIMPQHLGSKCGRTVSFSTEWSGLQNGRTLCGDGL